MFCLFVLDYDARMVIKRDVYNHKDYKNCDGVNGWDHLYRNTKGIFPRKVTINFGKDSEWLKLLYKFDYDDEKFNRRIISVLKIMKRILLN